MSAAESDAPDALGNALRLIYVVGREAARDWKRLESALEGGVTAFWLREPLASGSELYRTAKELAWRARERGAALIVGDRTDVALAVGAAGVQLGVRSPPARRVRPWYRGWIGVSCHSEAELLGAQSAGADYAVLSPVFGVPRKGEPLGTALFGRLRRAVSIPVVALGGLEAGNVQAVRDQGAAGVAVIRALRDSADALATARELAGVMTPR